MPIVGLLAFLAGCSAFAPRYEKPHFSVASIAITGGNLFQQNFLVKLNVENPNDRSLPVKSLHVELNVGGERVATGFNTHSFVVPPHGETQFDMNMSANMALALLKLAGRKDPQADSIDYEMTGGANLDLPFLRDLPFHHSGTLPLRLPQ